MAGMSRSAEDGQILIIVATAFFFVLVGTAAVTVDLGNGMLQQRRLQNITDAAAVAAAAELSRGGTATAAITVARDVVSSNTDAVVTLPSMNVYSGTSSGENLVSGILVSGSEVRVALQRQVSTYLAGVIGVKTLTVGAKSKAGSKWQGILPVAVKRFSAGDTSMAISADNPRRGEVNDYLATGNPPAALSAWPSPLSASAATPASDPGSSSLCDSSLAGPVMPFVGHDSQANVANGSDFHFWVAPDIRNITSLSPNYYNGVSGETSIQNLKNLETLYFQDGYPGVKQPAVGDELAAISGVNDEKTVQMMKKNHPWGSIVTAMLYDGTVYRKTDFNLTAPASVTTAALNLWSGSNHEAVIPVTLSSINGFSDTVVLDVNGPQIGDGPTEWSWRFDGGGLKAPVNVSLSGATTVYLHVWPNGTGNSSSPDWEGAITFQVTASSSTRLKTAVTTVVASNTQVFSTTTGESYKVVARGSSTQFVLAFVSWNNYGPSLVRINGYSAPGGVSVSFPTDSVTVKKNKPGSIPISIDVPSTATSGVYTLVVTAIDDNSPAQRQDLYLTLQILDEPATNVSQTTSYVRVLGYANFAITYAGNRTSPSSADNNTIYACAISDIKSDPSQLTKGMAPRLLPWR